MVYSRKETLGEEKEKNEIEGRIPRRERQKEREGETNERKGTYKEEDGMQINL